MLVVDSKIRLRGALLYEARVIACEIIGDNRGEKRLKARFWILGDYARHADFTAIMVPIIETKIGPIICPL